MVGYRDFVFGFFGRAQPIERIAALNYPHRVLGSLLILSYLFLPSAFAKGKTGTALPASPGEMRESAQGLQIFVDGGRRLLWPSQGALVLQDTQGSVLAQVDLREKVTRQSGAEAMGLTVEEVDLGGTLSGKKKYLSGKKAPTGRRLGALPESSLPKESGNTIEAVVQGIPVTTVNFPNGASLWKFAWPSFVEEIFFDKKKSMVYNRQTRKLGSVAYTLQQYADGSFSRHYQRSSGEFSVIFDANDRSYRLIFANPEGETVQEWNCEETCTEEPSS